MDDLTLRKYLRNELSEQQLVEVLDWLDASAENRQRLDRLDYVSNIGILFGEAGSRVFPRPMSGWKRTLHWGAGLAAGVLLCVGATLFLTRQAVERHARDFMSLTAPSGQSISVTLSDGTVVWLNAGSKLEYPTLFSSRRRQVKVSGEAMFEVEHDADWPFVVETFACEAEVLGTKFNILADAATRSFSATLLEGRLESRNLEHAGERLILSPDEEVHLVDGHLHLERIPDPDDFRWVDGLMNLNGLTFGEVIAKLERYYGVRIDVEHPEAISQRRYHGKIRVSYGIDHALDLLQMMTSDFIYMHDSETNTIYVKSRKSLPMN